MSARTDSPLRAVPDADGRRLDVALWLAANGYPVHPLVPGTKTPAPNCVTCRRQTHTPGSCPCLPNRGWCHGFHAATTDPSLVREWWRRQPDFGVGVSCGPAGLVVIDVDVHSGKQPDRSHLLPGIPIDDRVDLAGLASGYDSLALLAALRRQPDPAVDKTTLRVRTPSGGLHIWYRIPLGSPNYRSSSGSSSRAALAWQVDVRATGGYIVAPATRTPAGTYLALPGARTPALLPLWLHAELTRTGHTDTPRPPATTPAPRTRPTAKGNDAHRILGPLLDQVRACATAPSGTAFSEKLNRAAFTAGGLAAAGHVSLPQCLTMLTEAADLARPEQSRRNRLIIDSALRAGSNRPIHPKGRS